MTPPEPRAAAPTPQRTLDDIERDLANTYGTFSAEWIVDQWYLWDNGGVRLVAITRAEEEPETKAPYARLFTDIPALVAAVRQSQARETALADALTQIDQWASAYPVTVFRPVPPAQMHLAATVLREAGISMDAMHAEWARHIVSGIQEIVRKGLGEAHDHV